MTVSVSCDAGGGGGRGRDGDVQGGVVGDLGAEQGSGTGTPGARSDHQAELVLVEGLDAADEGLDGRALDGQGAGTLDVGGVGRPATDMVPMGMELVARVRPSVTRAAGAGTAGGEAEAGTETGAVPWWWRGRGGADLAAVTR